MGGGHGLLDNGFIHRKFYLSPLLSTYRVLAQQMVAATDTDLNFSYSALVRVKTFAIP